jgi:hypothetical protein
LELIISSVLKGVNGMTYCNECGQKLQTIFGNVSLKKQGIDVDIVGIQGVLGCLNCGTIQKLPVGVEEQINRLAQKKVTIGGDPYLLLNLLG